ncbi:hypothetical protein MKW98_008175 [Papaver atlanticum]|uniref:methionine S-methyltransferase n=1 Tax=Papaver atlanticum TaxID=357466 RepID=A0AAD4RWC3_9MAGN|nr:hypothetical protein MKW98_008175 [Papaver atlanticum]
MEEFLQQCKLSGDSAYNAFKSLLENLENPSTRTEARVFLTKLQNHFDSEQSLDQCFDSFHFRIHDILLEDKTFKMMEIPSIFIPEDWSYTFYEGLNRHPDSIFKDRSVAELGCGNGWISIALSQKWSPSKVYGLDINPRAIKVARINLYLNALDENGQLIYDEEKKSLLDRVEFHESDLLSYCRDHNLQLERIVGCIPQLLLTFLLNLLLFGIDSKSQSRGNVKLVTENAREEFLYSLTHATFLLIQGFVEDQFGLGLVAKAVEEGISVIKPMGIMIFNIGGRPGQAVCKRLFERRGFQVTELWQTKVIQAADTDISTLVEIEANSHHRFEFFMGLVGDQPICARTAWAYGKAGGDISHALSVYSCQLRQPNQVKSIFDFLKNGFQEISSSLDLSFDDDAVADEKIPFLAYLARALEENSFFQYEPPAGSTQFRSLIAGFLKLYHHIPLASDNVVVFPSRAVAIENSLRLFSPHLAIVDEHLTRHLPKQWLTSLAIEGGTDDKHPENVITVIDAPCQSDIMIELVKKLKPQVVITGMAQFESVTSSAFGHLLDTTRDIVLKYLAGNTLPPHAAIICGLVKNQVYSDLEVAFIISEEKTIFKALGKTIELLKGRTALFSQYYYGCLFHELLAFQLADRHPPAQRDFTKIKPEMIGFSSAATSAFSHAELSVYEMENLSSVHMDVDQSFLPIPTPVKAAIFESFARQNMVESETDMKTSIQKFIKSKYGFPTDNSTEIINADSPLALFNKLVLCCIQEGGTICFPTGSNGNYVSAAKFMNANILKICTHLETGFKLTEKTLECSLSTVDKPWVYLSVPTINPTGLLYSSEEIRGILSVCSKFGARVVIDTSFSGLEFNTGDWGGWNMEEILLGLSFSGGSTFCVSLLGGLSFEILAGGIAFGFLVLNQPHLVETFYTFHGLSKPHKTAKYAIKRLLGLHEQNAVTLLEALKEHKETLRRQSNRLRETLQKCGWEVLGSCAGVSMVAKPSASLGKKLKLTNGTLEGNGPAKGYEVLLNDSNIREAILEATGLCINSGLWTGIPSYCRFTTGIPSYCRFTFGMENTEFDKALECIVRFNELIDNST